MQGRTTFPLTSNEFLTKRLRISQENHSKNKADLFSVKDELDNTAIYYATAGGHLETVTILLKSGVNVNIKNEDGNTCLHKAMMNEDIKMIALLISNGADVEALNDKEQTPIYFASKRVRKEFCLNSKTACIVTKDNRSGDSSIRIIKKYLLNLKNRITLTNTQK